MMLDDISLDEIPVGTTIELGVGAQNTEPVVGVAGGGSVGRGASA